MNLVIAFVIWFSPSHSHHENNVKVIKITMDKMIFLPIKKGGGGTLQSIFSLNLRIAHGLILYMTKPKVD